MVKVSDLEAYFRQFGKLVNSIVIKDKRSGLSKGYGFVTFLNEKDAKRAVAKPAIIAGNASMLDRWIAHEWKGKENLDLLDRQKARFRVKTLGSLLTLNITEDDFDTTLEGVRAGPVRVVREVETEARDGR